MITLWKALRAAVVAAACGTLAYYLWRKFSREPGLPASPYPSAGARPAPMPANPPGPVEPALIAADPDDMDRPEDALPEDGIDLSAPLAAGDIDRID